MPDLFDHLKDMLSHLLPQPHPVDTITITRDVLDDIEEFAKANYPREFVAVLEGSQNKAIVSITGLFYQPFKSSSHTAIMQMNLPIISNAVGSVHSHPSSFTSPSQQDLHFFAKSGVVHLIIGHPYRDQDVACFDFQGLRRKLTVVQG